MRIVQADLELASAHELGVRSQSRTTVQVRRDPPPPPPAPPARQDGDSFDRALDTTDDIRLRLLELLFGARRSEVRLRFDYRPSQEVAEVARLAGQAGQAQAAPRLGWGAEITRHESYEEWESTAFSATGSIATADGRSIALSFDYRMERYFRSESSTAVRLGDAPVVDPLVLDLAGSGVRFSAETVGIDLDGDGRVETVHRPAAGAAFLALDRDGDGTVTRGDELFGPRTGQGFAELAQYDDDGNGAIDEGDAVWGRLRLWDGQTMTSLAGSGVGAILLPSLAAGFIHTDAANQAQAYTRRLGLYLREDGSAGAVAQVDLVV